MSSRARLLAALDEDLQRDQADYQRLLDLTEALHAHLLQRDAQQIERLNQDISSLSAAAAHRAARRSRILAAFSLHADADGMQRLFAGCPPAQRQRLSAGWEALGHLAQACQRQNERNGRLLAMQHDILNQLLGQSAQSSLYSPQYY